MCRRVALLALLGAARCAAADDVSALVQAQVQRHGHQEAVRLEGMERALDVAADGLSLQLLDAMTRLSMPASQAPDPAALGGIFIKRSGQRHEEGSGVDLTISKGCAMHDASGSNDCTLRWGDNATLSYRLRLASGLKKGDRISVSLASRFQAMNASDMIASVLTGKAVASGVSCDVCEGVCTASVAAAEGKFLMDTTNPSLLQNETYCARLETDPVSVLELPATTFSLPVPPAAWQLSGEVLTSIEVRSRDGAVRLSETLENKVLPGGAAAAGSFAARPPTVPSSLAAALEQSLRQVAPAMVSESRKAVAADKGKKGKSAGKKGKKISTIILKLHVSDLERASGQNITLSAEPGCTAVDGSGSTECHFDFAKASEVKVGMHLSFSTEDGAYAVVKTTPKVGGMLGLMASAFLKPTTVRLPLCGKGTVKLMESMPATDVDTGPCGFHAVNLVAPAYQLLLPDLAAISLKMPGLPPVLPPTVGDLPPTSVTVDAQMFHGDGSPIGNFKVEMGLGYASA